MKTLRYSNVQYSPRVPLILLTVEKIEGDNFDLFFFFFLSFPLHITQKLCGVYKRSAHQTNALLSDIFLFLVRAACELRSASYGSKHTSQSLSDKPFVCTYMHKAKTIRHIWTFYILNNCSTIGDIA